MRILMAAGVPRRREGGVATVVYNLGDELARRGHEVSYVFLDDLLPSDYPQRFKEVAFAHRLHQHIVAHGGELSLVNLHAPTGFLYGLRRKLSGARLPPYVMTLHGLEERRARVFDREADKGHQQNWSLRNRLWHRLYTRPRYRWSILTADGANTCARDTWNALQLVYGLDADRTAYTPHGVAERFFVPRSYDAAGGLKLLYAGTWLEQRGIYYIRQALPRLRAALPGLTLTFVGVGFPEDVVRGFFGPALDDVIRVLPQAPSGKMHETFAAHDVFLFPSLMEGLPSVVMEAMASGMPVITTETCGMPDVVEDGHNGLLVPPGDSRAIEAAVLRLGRSAQLRRSLGEAAQQTMKRYTWKRSADTLENLFRHILETEGKARA